MGAPPGQLHASGGGGGGSRGEATLLLEEMDEPPVGELPDGGRDGLATEPEEVGELRDVQLAVGGEDFEGAVLGEGETKGLRATDP